MFKKIILAVLFVAVSVFIYFFIASPYRISGINGEKGNCMEPAIKDGQLYFVNHLHYKLSTYKMGDIIIFRHEDKIWVSKIVGLENQEIKITDNTISLDNKIYSDSIQRNWQDWRYGHYGIESPAKIPSRHVYVLSDNLSAHHDDSRVFGPISYDNILGKVW
ncbi:signal peptidase IB [Holospora obtusa F1]|uniref:Signal peptidase I n=1 Tax=Holospora obtusa F1 TaxID=1399147 RepID=W6TER7_HOLOB|nr:signal peptidase I [Holospora obtusa]ETZ07359.1 signal peptidase IB [Holospora obtusa F1]